MRLVSCCLRVFLVNPYSPRPVKSYKDNICYAKPVRNSRFAAWLQSSRKPWTPTSAPQQTWLMRKMTGIRNMFCVCSMGSDCVNTPIFGTCYITDYHVIAKGIQENERNHCIQATTINCNKYAEKRESLTVCTYSQLDCDYINTVYCTELNVFLCYHSLYAIITRCNLTCQPAKTCLLNILYIQ